MIFYHWNKATCLNINVNEIFKSKKPGNVGRKSNLTPELISAVRNEIIENKGDVTYREMAIDLQK